MEQTNTYEMRSGEGQALPFANFTSLTDLDFWIYMTGEGSVSGYKIINVYVEKCSGQVSS